LLPLLHKIFSTPIALDSGGCRALILAPTRELAQQIGAALTVLGARLNLKTAVIFGGAPYNKQLRKLRKGVDVLVATPGRLMDHAQSGAVQFEQTEFFILDEADRMLDMGFAPDVKTFVARLPERHQTVMFSATMNRSVERLAAQLLTAPERVTIAKSAAVSSLVKHSVLHVAATDKKALLQSILENDKDRQNAQTIVFTKTKHGADRLSRDLCRAGFSADAIHGDRNQRQRQRSLDRFRRGDTQILVATDVAARGIDVPGVARVVNFDLPMEPDSYIHRVGRTGRNGAEGVAMTLCTATDMKALRDIERLLKTAIDVDADHAFHVDPPAGANRSPRKKHRGRSGAAERRGGKPAYAKRRRKPGGAQPATKKKRAGEARSGRASEAKPARRRPQPA
ncbi:MAG: DEAD/DEAH box helicase, partial [Pseudomonadota bacterium]